jgi:hypothetical protein
MTFSAVGWRKKVDVTLKLLARGIRGMAKDSVQRRRAYSCENQVNSRMKSYFNMQYGG